MANPPYAHSHPDFPNDTSKWEPLFTPFGNGAEECQREQCHLCRDLNPYHGHLNKVAFWAAKFASEMFAADSAEAKSVKEWGYLAGLWHDLGKFAPEWQTYLKSKADIESDEVSGKEDHSTSGAQHSDKLIPLFGRILAYPIAGHHAGLANGIDDSLSSLQNRLSKTIRSTCSAPEEVLKFSNSLPPPIFALASGHGLAFFIRMLFSSLVDADFLATESFMSPGRGQYRPTNQHSIAKIEAALISSLAKFDTPTTVVNRLRAEILTAVSYTHLTLPTILRV